MARTQMLDEHIPLTESREMVTVQRNVCQLYPRLTWQAESTLFVGDLLTHLAQTTILAIHLRT